jgi:hypothetical protein
MVRVQRKRFWFAVVTAGAVLAVVGIVHATIPDSGGVLHGCYANNNGSLRIVDNPATCKNNETAVSWSQTGPQGAQGPQGTQGIQGPQGPQGSQGPAGASVSSHAYSATNSVEHIPGDGNGHFVVTLAGLPAGNYMISSNVQVLFDGCTFCIGDPVADCYFDAGTWAGFPATQQQFGHDDRAAIPLMSAATLTGASNTVRVICTTYDRDATWIAADLFATQVDTLN